MAVRYGEQTPLPPDSISSRGPVQVVNVYSGKASECETYGIPAWLKEKFADFKKSLTGGGDHGGRGYKASWQPFVTNSVLILILLVVVGQAAFQALRPPTEERKDDNADRQLLVSMLAMMTARNQATVAAPPPVQSDAPPKIVVMPISLPSAPPSPATTVPSGKFQFEPLKIEVKTTSPSSDTGASSTTPAVNQKPPEFKPVELTSANPIMINAFLDSDNKCKKPTENNRPLIYFAFLNDGTSAIWIESIEIPTFRSADDKTFADPKTTETQIQSQPEVIYPGETYTRTSNCFDSTIGNSIVSREAPGFVRLGIKYRLKQGAGPVLIERAEFYVAPPTAPTRVGGFSGMQPN
jgi:hypothetical protein